jgi:hypothetical protein
VPKYAAHLGLVCLTANVRWYNGSAAAQGLTESSSSGNVMLKIIGVGRPTYPNFPIEILPMAATNW